MIRKAVLPGFGLHCTSRRPNPACSPIDIIQLGAPGVQFLLVGQTCVRARWPSNTKTEASNKGKELTPIQ